MRLLHIFLFFILISFNNLFSGSGSMIANTNNTTIYESEHHLFHEGDVNGNLVQGFVRINDGFSIDSNATASFDTFITVSGSIDLKNTGKMVLLSSIYFDQSVTFSPMGGFINGRGNSIVLQGDLSLPDNCILNISGDTVIDGNGYDLMIGRWGQIAVDDTVTLTLKNLTLKNSYTNYTIPPIRANGANSEITLDNVHVRLSDDFNFNSGKLFIHNDVLFTGTYKFSYNSVKHSRIVSNSCLYFGPNTTFEYYPSSTIDSLIVFDDESSTLYLDGCTLLSTFTGIKLSKGRLFLDNKVTFSLATNLFWYDFTSQCTIDYGTASSTGVKAATWSPDGTYLAIGGTSPSLIDNNYLRIYRFDGYDFRFITSAKYSVGVGSSDGVYAISWHPSGKYLAVGGQYTGSENELQIYSFDGSSLSLLSSAHYGGLVLKLSWRPDGNYLAAVGSSPAIGGELQLYEFTVNKNLHPVTSATHGNIVRDVDWHPNGEFIVIGGDDYALTEIRLYSFNNSILTLEQSLNYPDGDSAIVFATRWNKKGDYLAYGGSAGDGSGNIELGTFIFIEGERRLSLVKRVDFYGYSEVLALDWSGDGRYIAAGGVTNNPLALYDFNGIDIIFKFSTPVAFRGIGAVEFSKNNNFCLAAGDNSDQSVNPELIVYKVGKRYDTTEQTLSNGVIFGDSNIGIDGGLNVKFFGDSYLDLDTILIYESS